ncbi:hypothetical protein [Brachybacterium hainanense]|uniref:Uncharacterized protein n=1 Tax=Brachybacterium hainanense TaxID=1541174 RepID=A0ABV6RC02_9MICO
MTEDRREVLRRWDALPAEERDRVAVALLAVELLALPSDHLCQALVVGDGEDVSIVVAGVAEVGRAVAVEEGDDPVSLAARLQAVVDDLVARDEAISRVFDAYSARLAERLSRPITEEEIARSVAALERAERIQGFQARLRAERFREDGGQ